MLRVKVDSSDRLDLYEQVAAEIRRAIADGEAKPGERLPLAKDLAAVLGVNTNTALRALRLTPGNQPTATLDAAKLQTTLNAATIYYVNSSDYYADCGEPGGPFQGRISEIEYFKDDDVMDVSG